MATVIVSDYWASRYSGVGENLQVVSAWGLDDPIIIARTPETYGVDADYGGVQRLSGSAFTYDSSGSLTGGLVTGWDLVWGIWSPLSPGQSLSSRVWLDWGETRYSIAGLSIPAATLGDLLKDGDNRAPLLFDGPDTMTGNLGADTLWGYAGDDVLFGEAGKDAINGNMGNDTVHGGNDGDLVLGGKDDDILFGDDGSDVVNGNLGNDTGDGGDGNDVVRGGQGNDSVSGGAGDDWLSGDRGSDTLSGGSGADVFHSFGDAGLDRVLDFNRAEGDRVQLDPGTAYTVSQAGADVVIDMAGGGRVVLVGVSMGSLTDGWIFDA